LRSPGQARPIFHRVEHPSPIHGDEEAG